LGRTSSSFRKLRNFPNKMVKLNLTVIRSNDIQSSVKFYQLLGLCFELHSHGKGPKHYASLDTSTVFEIYPSTARFPVTIGTRIGFEVHSCGEVSSLLQQAGYEAKSLPKDSPWGVRAVFSDPDGHSVEITSKS